MKTSISKLVNQPKQAPKYVLFTNQYNCEIFINTEEEIGVDKIEDATKFSVGYDNEKIKVSM